MSREHPPTPSNEPPDIGPYLAVKTASPVGWSPDSTRLLVRSDAMGTAQLFLIELPSFGDLPPVDGPGWYPSGLVDSARFLAAGPVTQLTSEAGPVLGDYVPTRGPIETDGPPVDRVLIAKDVGGNERYQLFITDAEGGSLQRLVYDPDRIHLPGPVSRDGRYLAYSTNSRNGVDLDVHVVDLESRIQRPLWAPGGWTGPRSFSPDGLLLVTYALSSPGDNRLYIVELETGQATEIAPHSDPAFLGVPQWLPDSSAFYFPCSVGRDRVAVARWDRDTGAWEYVHDPGWDCDVLIDRTGSWILVTWNENGVTRGCIRRPGSFEMVDDGLFDDRPGVVSAPSFSNDGMRLAWAFSSPDVPGDVFGYDLRTHAQVQLTNSPRVMDHPGAAWELRQTDSFDGETIPFYLATPSAATSSPGVVLGPTRPVVIWIHGGPEGQARPSYNAFVQYLVACGFTVMAPNVRGSTGYGKRFQSLDDGRKRLDAVEDLVALRQWIADNPELNEARVALVGGSYGGYLVLAGLAFHPDLWAGGVDIVGISSLVTFLQSIPAWARATREREYGSLEHDLEFLTKASPLTRVDAIRAPLFMIHGANDPRVPVSEAQQLHDRLTERGVSCELLIYEDEGHGLSKLANRLDAYPRAAKFLHELLTS